MQIVPTVFVVIIFFHCLMWSCKTGGYLTTTKQKKVHFSYCLSANELTHWPMGNLNQILWHVIFKQILVIDDWGICFEIALIWMSLDFTDDQSILVQAMAWCRQATRHYLCHCWPRSLSPYGVTRPRLFNHGKYGYTGTNQHFIWTVYVILWAAYLIWF